MAVLNLRDVPDELAAQLKSEAALAGISLRDYCVAIWKARGEVWPVYALDGRTGAISVITNVDREIAKKIADISAGGGATKDGGDSGLPRGGKAQFPDKLDRPIENASTENLQTAHVGYEAMTAKIADEVLRENGEDIYAGPHLLEARDGSKTFCDPRVCKFCADGIFREGEEVLTPAQIESLKQPGWRNGPVMDFPWEPLNFPGKSGGTWVGENRDLDPSNAADVAAWQERDRQAAEMLDKSNPEDALFIYGRSGIAPDFNEVHVPKKTISATRPESVTKEKWEKIVQDEDQARRNHKWSEARLRKIAEEEPGGLMACSPEILGVLKQAAEIDAATAHTLHAAGVKLDREILVRWGLAENYKPKSESVDGVEGRSKARKTAGATGRSAKAVTAGDDVPKSDSVGAGKPDVDMQALRNICAGEIPQAYETFKIDHPHLSKSEPIEVDLCGFESYNETDGENYVCGKEKHGLKVKHGDWIKI